MRLLKYSEAILEAQDLCLDLYPESLLMGLGVPDPKGIFGTTIGLQQKYGNERVFDIPLSENAITGVALGAAISGMRPILTHQRLDFALVSIEQIVNQAAKWGYMFNGLMSAPLLIRMVVGRGWGQGPQHSQSLHSWFSHIPGLKVIMPSNPFDAKGMIISAVKDNNPVICIEHRWLYETSGEVHEGYYEVPIGEANTAVSGTDITIVGLSYSTLECLQAAKKLAFLGISAEVIDLRSVRPIDSSKIFKSVNKTGRLIVVDYAEALCSIASEIISTVAEKGVPLQAPPIKITLPNYPTPTSQFLEENYYPGVDEIVVSTLKILGEAGLAVDGNIEKKSGINFFSGPF